MGLQPSGGVDTLTSSNDHMGTARGVLSAVEGPQLGTLDHNKRAELRSAGRVRHLPLHEPRRPRCPYPGIRPQERDLILLPDLPEFPYCPE